MSSSQFEYVPWNMCQFWSHAECILFRILRIESVFVLSWCMICMFHRGTSMLYTFYSVIQRDHLAGLWRGLVPVSIMQLSLCFVLRSWWDFKKMSYLYLDLFALHAPMLFWINLVTGHVPTHPFPEASPDPDLTLTQTLDLTQRRVGMWPATEQGPLFVGLSAIYRFPSYFLHILHHWLASGDDPWTHQGNM